MIHLKEPDFWRFFFWNEHIRRLVADNAQHKEPFWFFFLPALWLAMPWTFIVPAAVSGIKARLLEARQPNRLLGLCICWLVMPLLFFSLSKGKMLTYILPCFPPFAILMAFGILQALKQGALNRLFQGGAVICAVLSGLILVALLYVQFFGFNGFRPYSQSWKAVVVANGFVFFALFCFWSFRSRSAQAKSILFGTAPLLLFFVVHYTIPDLVLEVKSPGPILEKHKQGIADDDVVISDEASIRAVCWYLRRSDVYMLGGAGELDYGSGYKDAEGRSLDIRSAADFLKQNRGKTILVARVRSVSRWRDQLPQPVYQDQSGPSGYVFWKY